MSTASDLLAAIQLHPDEDTPRLIYADYLDENDQSERAEFIRIQIERARLPHWELRTKQIWHRERVLLAHHGQEWYRELGTIEGVEWGRFERGFVCAVRIPSMKILRRSANAIRAVAPIENIVFTSGDTADDGPPLPLDWVRGIELSGYSLYDDDQDNAENLEDDPYASRGSNRANRLTALLNSGITSNLHRLSLKDQGIENPGAMAIARATHLTQLRELDLAQCFVGNAGVGALSGAKHLASLETLIFRSGGSGYVEDPFVTDDGIARLAAGDSVLRSLRKVDFSGSRISDQGMQLLLTSPSFAHLEEVSLNTYDCTARGFDVGTSQARRWKTLKVSGFAMQDESIGRFNELPQLNSLAVLKARGCHFTPSGVRMLARAPFASNLRVLDLSDNGFGSEGVRELASGKWEHLHTLNFARNKVDYKGVDELAKTGKFSSLYELDLTENKISDPGIQAIAGAGWAKSLSHLMLETNQISSAGIIAITESSVLCGLTDLKLDNNPIGPDGVQAIASANWPELTDLSLKTCKASEAAILALIRSPLLGKLLELNLADCEITATVLKNLCRADLPFLCKLSLDSNTGIGAEGVNALITPGALPSLRVLSLVNCKLAEAVLAKIANSELMTRLCQFAYYGNTISRKTHELFTALASRSLGADWLEEDQLGSARMTIAIGSEMGT